MKHRLSIHLGLVVRLLAAVSVAATLSAAEGVWLDVPFIRQQAEGCGAASLAMVMDYWHGHGTTTAPADAQQIYLELYVREHKGILADAMQAYLRTHGFTAFAFSGEWSDLRHHVDQGRPLIVALKSGADSFHYVVVAGASDSTISLNDPADRKLRLYSRSDFEKRWLAAGQWTLLAVPLSQP
jgi:predicted double-glycine peptidase